MLKQQGITSAGDVYQIGVVLYEMLVGMPPYYNDNIKVLYQNIEKGKLKMPKYLTTEAKKFLLVRQSPRFICCSLENPLQGPQEETWSC